MMAVSGFKFVALPSIGKGDDDRSDGVDLSDWQMPMAVLGLLLALLLSAGLVNRYHQYRAAQRALLRALVQQVQGLEQALDVLAQVPIGRALRSALRARIHGLYQHIRAIHRDYPEIDHLLEVAAAKIQADGGVAEGRVPTIEGEAHFRKLLSAIDRLIGELRGVPATPQQRQQWRVELLERRAEVLTRHHIVQAHRQQKEGRRQDAIAYLQHLLGELQRRGPDTEFVRALYEEADTLYQRLLQGKSLEKDDPEGDDQRADQSSAA